MLDHLPASSQAGDEHPGQILLDDIAPLLERGIFRLVTASPPARVVDHDVEGTKGVDRLGDQRVDRVRIGDVDGDRQCTLAFLGDPASDPLDVVAVSARHHDVCSRRRVCRDHRSTEPACATRDDRRLAVQPEIAHVRIPRSLPAEILLCGANSTRWYGFRSGGPVTRMAEAALMRHNELTDDQVDFYHHHGYLHLPAVFSTDEIARMADELDWQMDTWAAKGPGWSGPWRRVYMPAEVERRSKLIALHDLHRYSKAWCDAVTHPRLAGAIADLIGPNVELHHTTLHAKPPETGHPFPMHQD